MEATCIPTPYESRRLSPIRTTRGRPNRGRGKACAERQPSPHPHSCDDGFGSGLENEKKRFHLSVRFWTGFWRPKKIQILGMEFSGRVEAVGRAVTHFGEGDEVFGSTGFRFGTHAKYVCLPEDALLATKAHNITFEEAAAVLFGGYQHCIS